MNIKILRQRGPGGKPYWQEFYYEKNEDQSVAGMLDELNYEDDLKDIYGNAAPRIQWECSCLQGMCGACAMVINGVPALACATFLRDTKGDKLTVEPLRKFPTVTDLVVDRGIIQDNLRDVNAYIGEYKEADPDEYDHMYSAAKCLKCGLCLEVCPNYSDGRTFFGALFANDSYLIAKRSKISDQSIKKEYNKHFAKGCSKSLSCVDVCPAKIPTLASIGKMNK